MNHDQAYTLAKQIPPEHMESIRSIALDCVQPFLQSKACRLRTITSGPLPRGNWLIWAICVRDGVLVHYQITFDLTPHGPNAVSMVIHDSYGMRPVRWMDIPGHIRDLARTLAKTKRIR